MSISASIAGTAVFLLNKIQKIPRRIINILWAVPFLRMWIPIGMNSKYSLMSLISKFTTRSVVVYEGSADFSMTNFVMAADTYFPVTYKAELLKNVFQIAAIVWLVVASALLIAVLLVYSVTKSELKDSRHWCDNIYLSDKITSPSVYGIFRAKIIIPQAYETDDLKFILMHENTHIKRKDNLRRIIGIITACIHWFNPLSWLFLKGFLESIEYACDEAVLRKCGEAERKSYALSLVNCIESKNLYSSGFGGARVRVRIKRILSYKKLSALSITAFATLAVVVGYVLLTNAIQKG
ncbi:MAG: M56 family metallopeptidase [Acutalibacteraceae bacterium]